MGTKKREEGPTFAPFVFVRWFSMFVFHILCVLKVVYVSFVFLFGISKISLDFPICMEDEPLSETGGCRSFAAPTVDHGQSLVATVVDHEQSFVTITFDHEGSVVTTTVSTNWNES